MPPMTPLFVLQALLPSRPEPLSSPVARLSYCIDFPVVNISLLVHDMLPPLTPGILVRRNRPWGTGRSEPMSWRGDTQVSSYQ